MDYTTPKSRTDDKPVMRKYMRNFFTFILTINLGIAYGQVFSYPTIQNAGSGRHMTDFVPTGWAILDSAMGDLNNDGTNDVVLILQQTNGLTIVNKATDTAQTKARILLLLLKNPVSHNYEVTEQSNSFILKYDNDMMEDPYLGLTINKGILEIRFYLFYTTGSWYVTNAAYKFRYQQGEFCLIGAEKSSFHRATHDYEEYSYNFLSNKRILTKGNENKGKKKIFSKTLDKRPLKTIKTLIEPFSWEVEPDVIL